jgi:hypothetical protein
MGGTMNKFPSDTMNPDVDGTEDEIPAGTMDNILRDMGCTMDDIPRDIGIEVDDIDNHMGDNSFDGMADEVQVDFLHADFD